MNKIGVFVESPRFLQHALYLSKGTDFEIVTSSREVYEKLSYEVDSLNFFKKDKLIECISFKKKIRHLSLDCIILFSDSSPVANWIQNQFYTIMIFDDSMLGRDLFYYKILFLTFSRRQSIVDNVLQYLLGPSAEINGKLYKTLPNKIGSLVHFFKNRLCFGYKVIFADLPGRYSKHIAVGNEEIKNVYVKFGMPAEVISVVGSLEYDFISSQAKAVSINNLKSKGPDVIFFTQPFNKYSWGEEFWIEEVKSFVDDCEKCGASYLLALHPRDDVDFYRKYVNHNYIIENVKSFEEKVSLIRSSKLAVIKSSSVINTILALRKPVAYINYGSFFPQANIIDYFKKEMIIYKNNNIADILNYVRENSTDIINHQEETSFRSFPEIGNAKNNIQNIIHSSLEERKQ